MSTTLQSIYDAALQLSEAERLELADRLFDSVPEAEPIDVDDPNFIAEMERRAKEPVSGIPWTDIYAEG